MRRFGVLLLLCWGLAGPALAQPKLATFDNFAPATDADLQALVDSLKAVPSAGQCDAARCPEYSCPDAVALEDALQDATELLSVLSAALQSATADYRSLLGAFQQEYERLTADDETRRRALIWSHALLAAGKLTLDAASILDGLGSLRDFFAKVAETRNGTDDAITAARLVDQLFEVGSSSLSIADGFLSDIGKTPMAPEDLSDALTIKSGLSDLSSGIASLRDAVNAYRAAQAANDLKAMAAAAEKLENLQPLRANLGQLAGKVLSKIAELQQKALAAELAENAKNESAQNKAFADNYRRYIRLIDRQAALRAAMRRLQDATTAALPCAARCAEWSGVRPALRVDGLSYGEILKTYNAKLAASASAIMAAAAKVDLKPGIAPTIGAVPVSSRPRRAMSVAYRLATCPANQGARLQLLDPGFVASDLGEARLGEPASLALTAPADPGQYLLALVDAHSRALAKASFTVVEPPKDEDLTVCNVILPAGMAVDDPDKGIHLKPKSFSFSIGKPEDKDYVAGRLTVMPGSHCVDGKIGFPLFGGVSRQADYFKLELSAGRAADIRYPEQWMRKVTVRFDTGALISSSDYLLIDKVPAGAKRVAYVAMEFDGGPNAKTVLNWYPN